MPPFSTLGDAESRDHRISRSGDSHITAEAAELSLSNQVSNRFGHEFGTENSKSGVVHLTLINNIGV